MNSVISVVNHMTVPLETKKKWTFNISEIVWWAKVYVLPVGGPGLITISI